MPGMTLKTIRIEKMKTTNKDHINDIKRIKELSKKYC
jgi:hypothetical protein